MNRRRLQVLYEGNVQGVGFRYTVKNLPDGRVELVAEGVEKELTAFQKAIRESELGHFIRQEEIAWREAQGGLRGFEIAR